MSIYQMLFSKGADAVGAFESIASASGTGSSGTITFSSIPGTYQHLQLRVLARSDGTNFNALLRLNGDTGNNYVRHSLIGNGSTVTADSGTALNSVRIIRDATNASASNVMGVTIVDIHDYASTTKNTTVRSFTGVNNNSTSTDYTVSLNSGLWINTNAVTSLSVIAGNGNWTTATRVDLYGIKAAA